MSLSILQFRGTLTSKPNKLLHLIALSTTNWELKYLFVCIENTSNTLLRLVAMPSYYSCSHNKDNLTRCLRTNEKTILLATPSVRSGESRPHSRICYFCKAGLQVIVSHILHRLQPSKNFIFV